MTSLTIGQRTPLSKLGVTSSAELSLNVAGSASDYDVACFVLGAGGKLLSDDWMVFYNQPRSPDGAVTMRRSGPANNFSLSLSALSPQVERLAFTLSPDGADMHSIASGELRVGDGIWAFRGSDFGVEKAIIAAEIYKHQGEWRLMINGQGFASGLSGLVEHFGGQLAPSTPSTPSAPPAPPTPAPAPTPTAPPVAPPTPTISLTKVTLDKQGQSARISLQKAGTQRFHVNLNWESRGGAPQGKGGFFERLMFQQPTHSSADLDLGCMYELQDGDKGVIQALGGRMGRSGQPPYIYLDQDDRSGVSAGGENLYIERPDLIRRVLIFAFIYEGVGNFSDVGGRLSFTDPQGNDVRMTLSNPATLPFCAVAMLETRGQELTITKEERYFADHEKCDAVYNFGFRWAAGRK